MMLAKQLLQYRTVRDFVEMTNFDVHVLQLSDRLVREFWHSKVQSMSRLSNCLL